jgi:predicted signal transduction protein with EAL and GGDEF domain
MPGDAGAVLLPIFLLGAALSVFVLAAVVEGLSDSTEVQRQLTRQAYRDDLTGLPNRRYLVEYLSGQTATMAVGACGGVRRRSRSLQVRQRRARPPAAGDEVLIEVARRLERAFVPETSWPVPAATSSSPSSTSSKPTSCRSRSV